MLKSHMDAVESSLLATSKIPANSGHSLHKGTPRETFIRGFLESHLPSNVAVGTGEIIDSDSRPGDFRNQYDIVIYRRSYPKLDFGGGITAFLIESVIATIEVKSTLTQIELGKAAKAAKNCKALRPNTTESFRTGYMPPSVLNYVVAYDGPVQMETIYKWIGLEYSKLNIESVKLPPVWHERTQVAAKALDAVFVLGKGFVQFDNSPLSLGNEDIRRNGAANWIFAEQPTGSLLILFMLIQMATANVEGKWLDAMPYISNAKVNGFHFGE